MACRRCKHFNELGEWRENIGKDPRLIHGQCTLQPEWRKVVALHYCGQFHAAYERMPSAVSDEICQRFDWPKKDQRARAIKAEKKLKEVRAELRDVKCRRA